MIGRGFERIKVERLPELFAIMENPSNKDFGDVEIFGDERETGPSHWIATENSS